MCGDDDLDAHLCSQIPERSAELGLRRRMQEALGFFDNYEWSDAFGR